MEHSRAYTLLELLIALAISAMMTTLAYPAYVSYEAHANRNHAEVALMELTARLEDYFTSNNTYQSATANDLKMDNLESDLPYQLVLANVSDTHFTIQAIPNATQGTQDSSCGTLSITDTAHRTISGSGGVDACWS